MKLSEQWQQSVIVVTFETENKISTNTDFSEKHKLEVFAIANLKEVRNLLPEISEYEIVRLFWQKLIHSIVEQPTLCVD